MGKYLRSFGGKKGHGPGELHDPTGIDVDLNGNFVICDRGKQQLQTNPFFFVSVLPLDLS